MSRIIVRNLPKNVTEEKLRNTFSSRGGTITDLQLKYTPDGRFRQFCFIGFKTDEEAQEALRYYNNSCIQTSRIKVELWQQNALPIEKKLQQLKERNNSKSKGGEENDRKESTEGRGGKLSTREKVQQILAKHKDDPEFQEFLKMHESKWAVWSNDLAADDHQMAVPTTKQKIDVREESNEEEEEEAETPEEKLADKPISDLEYMRSLVVKGNDDDDDTITTTTTTAKESMSKLSTMKLNTKNRKCLDTNELFTIKIHNIAFRTKRQDIVRFFKPLRPYSIRIPTKVRGFCYVGFKTRREMEKAMLKNKSFIKGKQVFFSDFTEKNKITAKGGGGGAGATIPFHKNKTRVEEENGQGGAELDEVYRSKWQKQEASVKEYEDIGESGSIFFRNLAYSIKEEDLEELFSKYGPLAEIHLPVDPITLQIKGFGTVTYVMPEHAVQAFNQLDGTTFHGRLLHLIPGKSWTHGDGEEDDHELDGGKLSFKAKKAKALKQSAQQSHNWNTLFLGANAVADLMATKFSMDKERILDMDGGGRGGGSNAAVRLALGETQIVTEMRKFLEENQVCLEAFNNGAVEMKRSKNIILVKNLPAATTSEELLNLFRPFGTINRLILPPQGVTAIVEFTVSFEANKAFKKLAYSQFKCLPLYLEWAPINTFKDTVEQKSLEMGDKVEKQEEKETTQDNKNAPLNEAEIKKNESKEEDDDDDDEPLPEENTTLFIRNLNFNTQIDAIRQHFSKLGAIHTIEIAQRRDPEKGKVSLGYGFIQFKRRSVAEEALKTMQFSSIDGNVIELKRSEKILKTPESSRRRKTVSAIPQTGTKILVRNIPFQAKVKEIRDIFQAFGELRTVRLPLKLMPGETSRHRGFGFVDFVSKNDAHKAFEALRHSTHVYGRRLVLEWASLDTESDVNVLRKRVAEQFPGDVAGKRGCRLPTKSQFNKSLENNNNPFSSSQNRMDEG